jgi:hypothetical protein
LPTWTPHSARPSRRSPGKIIIVEVPGVVARDLSSLPYRKIKRPK